MEKFLLFPIIFILLISGDARANLQESYKKKQQLNETICSYEDAQFKFIVESEFQRICVDNKKGTVFIINKVNSYAEDFITRVNGYLNKGQNRIERASNGEDTYFREEWRIEDDKLILYKCLTYSLESKSCKDNIVRKEVGIKR